MRCPTCGAPRSGFRCKYCRTWLNEGLDPYSREAHDRAQALMVQVGQMMGSGLISAKTAARVYADHPSTP